MPLLISVKMFVEKKFDDLNSLGTKDEELMPEHQDDAFREARCVKRASCNKKSDFFSRLQVKDTGRSWSSLVLRERKEMLSIYLLLLHCTSYQIYYNYGNLLVYLNFRNIFCILIYSFK